MFWKHDSEPAHDHQPGAQRVTPRGGGLRRSVSAGLAMLILLSLAMPFSSVAAAGKSGRALLAEWSAVSRVSVVQQSSGSISYSGPWRTAYHASYMDGKARSTKARSAKASLQFTGSAIAWVGPVGPSRGKARVYIDGRLIKTVNTWASTFRASRVLFTASWAKVGTHRISIVTNGTAGHPTVALDAFLVRGEATAPTPTPAGPSVRVTSVAALLAALADNSISEIVVANGTYRVSPAASKASNSLWIGSRFASRTRAVTVRAETSGGVTFDGGGTSYFGGLSFQEGAHHQTWDGFVFANGTPTSTGVVMFGGYNDGSAAPHHITMRNIRFLASIRGSIPQDHFVYISSTSTGTGGPHDLLFEDIHADGSGGIMSAFNFGHDIPTDNAWNVTVRRLTAVNLNTAIVVWEGVLHDLLFEDITLTNSARFGVRYENSSDYRVTFRNVVSSGSGTQGFYSSLGTPPPGVVLSGCTFR
jgi:hypothetical protein